MSFREDTGTGVRRRAPLLSLICVALLAPACAYGRPGGSPPPGSPSPAATRQTASPPAVRATRQVAPTGWAEVQPGLYRREVYGRPGGSPLPPAPVERLILFRISPAHFRFRVRYSPGQPLPVSGWAAQAPGAALIFNAGYFDAQYRATALVVADGAASGLSYSGFGGMFGVHTCPPAPLRFGDCRRSPTGGSGGRRQGGGVPFLRSLAAAPVLPAERFEQALQSAPMLLGPGGVFDHPDPTPARRAVIAQTRGGDFVLIFAPEAVFSLAGLAGWLAASDLDLQAALNLDGGSSAGYWHTRDDWRDSSGPVPAVVVVEPG